MDTVPSPIGPQDPRLMQPALEVDPNSPEALATAKLLQDYMLTQDVHGVGMAATQFGIAQQVLIANVNAGQTDDDGNPLPAHWVAFYNARIVEASQETDKYWEGCYSVGTGQSSLDIRVNVSSPLWIRVSGWCLDLMDPAATVVKLVNVLYEGFVARILRHEIDHTENRTIMAYIDEPSDVHHVPQSRLDEHRESHPTWPPAPRHLWHRLLRFTRQRKRK